MDRKRSSLQAIMCATYGTLQDSNDEAQAPSTGTADSRRVESVEISEHRGEREKLLGVFPEEIWDLILDYVTEPQHFENISQSSPFFKNLVDPRKVVYLFPSVWKVLAVKYQDKNINDSSYNHAIEDDDPSTRIMEPVRENGTCSHCGGTKYVQWFTGILSMRSVCRAWNKAIDNFYQATEYISGYPNRHVQPILITRECFSSLERAERCIQHFAKTHDAVGLQQRNPFLGRNVELIMETDDVEGFDPYFSRLSTMLQKFGNHIWHCEIKGSYSIDAVSSFYSKLREMLRHMPNLKTLMIEFASDEFEERYAPPAPHLNPLNSVIRENPMEVMNGLESLEIGANFPGPMFNEMIRCSTSISKIYLNLFEVFDPESLNQLQNVKHLSTTTFSGLHFEKLAQSTKQLLLENLELKFDYNGLVVYPDIFTAINESPWAATLTDLQIEMSIERRDGSRSSCALEKSSLTLELKCLKHLNLYFENYTSLDFILPMSQTLETLDITIVLLDTKSIGVNFLQVVADATEKKLKFIGYYDRPLESNIWNLFKKLKRFRFLGTVIGGGREQELKWSHSRFDWWTHQKRTQGELM